MLVIWPFYDVGVVASYTSCFLAFLYALPELASLQPRPIRITNDLRSLTRKPFVVARRFAAFASSDKQAAVHQQSFRRTSPSLPSLSFDLRR